VKKCEEAVSYKVKGVGVFRNLESFCFYFWNYFRDRDRVWQMKIKFQWSNR